MLDRAEHVLLAVGGDGRVRVGGHLVRVVGVHARRRAPDRSPGPRPPPAPARRSRRGRAARPPTAPPRAASRADPMSAGSAARRKVGERVELAALLARDHPWRHVPLLAARPRAPRRERRRAAAHPCSSRRSTTMPPRSSRRSRPKIVGVGVGAPEAEQEQLGDLALQRQPPRQVGHAARHRGSALRVASPPAAGRSGRGTTTRSSGAPRPGVGHVRGGAEPSSSCPRAHDHAGHARAQGDHRDNQDGEPAPVVVQAHRGERYWPRPRVRAAIVRRHADDRHRHRGDEVRRHVRRRCRAHQARGPAHRAQQGGGHERGGRAVRSREAHGRARFARLRGLGPRPTRARWTCCSRPASA